METETLLTKVGDVPFSFSILRYFADPSGGDFVNVGVALHSPRLGFLGVRTGGIADHVRDLFPTVNPDELRRDIDAVEGLLLKTKPERIATGEFAMFLAQALPAQSRLGWSVIHKGMTADGRETLNELCERLVDRAQSAIVSAP
ncbi:hypothetical protein ACVIGB_000568 [Bradyrhizobium sp. USDA 4341]